jgi:NAD+ kinase
VSKKSAYQLYVREHKMPAVTALLAANDASVARLKRADDDHQATLDELRHALSTLGIKASFRDRSKVGKIQNTDLVITVGGDGTLLGVSHQLSTTPIVGINSAPLDSVGFLCGIRKGEVLEKLRKIVTGKLKPTPVSRVAVSVDGVEVTRHVLNEVLFAHKNPAMTSRYILQFRDSFEEHKSSGIYVGPACGSTAAIRSAGGKVLPLDSKLIQLLVREPYTPDGAGFAFEHALAKPNEHFEVVNKMREGVLFIDGPRTMIPVEIGQRIRFSRSPEPLLVFGIDAARKRVAAGQKLAT